MRCVSSKPSRATDNLYQLGVVVEVYGDKCMGVHAQRAPEP